MIEIKVAVEKDLSLEFITETLGAFLQNLQNT